MGAGHMLLHFTREMLHEFPRSAATSFTPPIIFADAGRDMPFTAIRSPCSASLPHAATPSYFRPAIAAGVLVAIIFIEAAPALRSGDIAFYGTIYSRALASHRDVAAA